MHDTVCTMSDVLVDVEYKIHLDSAWYEEEIGFAVCRGIFTPLQCTEIHKALEECSPPPYLVLIFNEVRICSGIRMANLGIHTVVCLFVL